ncbi:MAG: lipid A deacylase LpxR family protein [Longimicrobiales bacterium]
MTSRHIPSRLVRTALTALTLVGAALGPAALHGQDWVGWSFYWENDTWVPPAVGSDDAFTNGIRIVLGRGIGAPLPGAGFWADRFTRENSFDVTSSLVLGQNFFTPRTITRYTPDPSDRPYAGFSYVGMRYDATRRLRIEDQVPAPNQRQSQHSLEWNLGVLGQGAAGRKFQSSVHSVITTHRVPKGWSHQIGNSLGASALYMYRSRWVRSLWDVTLHGGGLLGTTQTYPAAGLTVRLGKGLSGFPGVIGRNTAVATQSRHPVEFGLAAGAEGRFMLHNAFVEGALGARGSPGVEATEWLGDYRLGAFLRILDARVDYWFVRRSPEVAAAGPSFESYDNYGSLSVSYEPGTETLESLALSDFFAETLPSWFDGFFLEVGFGTEIGPDEPGAGATHVMHGAVGRRLWRDLDIGLERSGAGREFGPAPSSYEPHVDRLLYTTAAILRYRPLGGRFGPFDVHVRGGWGGGFLGGTNETELTYRRLPTGCPGADFVLDAAESPLEDTYCNRLESGTSTLFGGGVSWRPVGEELGIALDVVRIDVGAGAYPSFTGWSVGMRWTPNEY